MSGLPERLGERAREVGLPDAGRPFEEERARQLEREPRRQRRPWVGEVARLRQEALELGVRRGDRGHGR